MLRISVRRSSRGHACADGMPIMLTPRASFKTQRALGGSAARRSSASRSRLRRRLFGRLPSPAWRWRRRTCAATRAARFARAPSSRACSPLPPPPTGASSATGASRCCDWRSGPATRRSRSSPSRRSRRATCCTTSRGVSFTRRCSSRPAVTARCVCTRSSKGSSTSRPTPSTAVRVAPLPHHHLGHLEHVLLYAHTSLHVHLRALPHALFTQPCHYRSHPRSPPVPPRTPQARHRASGGAWRGARAPSPHARGTEPQRSEIVLIAPWSEPNPIPIRFTPDAHPSPHSAKVWATERADSVVTLSGHAGPLHGIAWSPHHANRLLTASADGTVRRYQRVVVVALIVVVVVFMDAAAMRER